MRPDRRALGTVVLTCTAAAVIVGCDAPPRRPLLLVEPTMNGDPSGQPPDPAPGREACLNPDLWPSVWERMDVFGQAAQFFAAPGWSDADLSQCFSTLRASGKQLVVAVGALKPHCATGQACWDAVLPMLQRVRGQGGRIAYLEIDEPLTTGRQASYAYVLRETAAFIRLARRDIPGVGLILQEAYPHQSVETLARFYRDVNRVARALTGTGLQYAQLDHDWLRGGTAADVARLQRALKADGVGFGVIFWRADPSLTWHEGLMKQGELYSQYRASSVEPGMYAVINWTGAPTRTLPEWAMEPERPFMSAVRDFVRAFVPDRSAHD